MNTTVGAGHGAIGFAIARDLRPVTEPRIVGRDTPKGGRKIGALEERRRQWSLRRRGRLARRRDKSRGPDE